MCDFEDVEGLLAKIKRYKSITERARIGKKNAPNPGSASPGGNLRGRQNDGTTMGNPLYPFIAEVFMQHFENHCKKTFSYFPEIRIQYSNLYDYSYTAVQDSTLSLSSGPLLSGLKRLASSKHMAPLSGDNHSFLIRLASTSISTPEDGPHTELHQRKPQMLDQLTYWTDSTGPHQEQMVEGRNSLLKLKTLKSSKVASFDKTAVSSTASHVFHERVLNISNHSFSTEETQFLDLGLKYSPNLPTHHRDFINVASDCDSALHREHVSIKYDCAKMISAHIKEASPHPRDQKLLKSIKEAVNSHNLIISKAIKATEDGSFASEMYIFIAAGNGCVFILFSSTTLTSIDRVLGLEWQPMGDYFHFEINLEPEDQLDSMDVLYWLHAHPSHWSTFVGKHCADINSWVPAATLNHLPSDDNLADPASRGVSPATLKNLPIWWSGPRLLHWDKRSSLYSKSIIHNLADAGTNWHYNPSAAPYFGEIWNAAVKPLKMQFHRGNFWATCVMWQ
ncbi:hypothetical protein J437_LFUL015355 [Ladona fulva]|uniref:Uncharacterized protein n=1 Tax=Ladona fulva TaxID=123851 RepID=A0A8K0KGN9_LADFU|nr:hypothetical protein J437_LFUL015355 [Ladona fulva]